ncbi:conserved hypothetical protein, secreted [Candidatus Magnetomorum sp. HK-1]|nr:conserved hypothetical protein, secreted [Candidatus Magnetomorum sp. HK-1]
MKKIIISLSLVSLIAFGCTNSAINGNNQKVYVHQALKDAPNWVRAPNFEGGIATIGSQKIGAAGINFARENAIAFARNSLANSIETKVKNIINNSTKSMGMAKDVKVDRLSTHVSKQSSSQLIKGSRHVDTWISTTGELYVLVVVGLDKSKKTIRQNTLSSFKNDNAMWQQFQAREAFKELDEQIDKEFGN